MSGSAEALLFDVQRFSVHDGPGIRTTVFFKGCPLRCPWCQNPESLRPHPELVFHLDRCRDEGACFGACPRNALVRTPDRITRDRCDACGLCLAACPFGALQRVGRTVSVEGLLEQTLRDEPFYRSSGGGVTLSGGEATMQMDFVGRFAGLLRREGVGVALQTCGAFSWEAFAPFRTLFDLIQFDLKVIDPAAHRALLGVDNHAILSNARRLVSAGAPVEFRMPVVPGGTDSEENLRGVGRFLTEAGVPRIQLLAYHAMGEAKLPRLGFPLLPWTGGARGRGANERGAESLERAVSVLEAEGIEVAS